MERLTKRGHKKQTLLIGTSCNYGYMSYDCQLEEGKKLLKLALDKLAEYEDLEEQGRLLKLPCKVGDTVYCIFNRYTRCTFSNEEFDEYSCQGCEYECDSKKENYVQDMKAYSLDWIVTNLKNFGKTVFLTKSEAESKLKELRGTRND